MMIAMVLISVAVALIGVFFAELTCYASMVLGCLV